LASRLQVFQETQAFRLSAERLQNQGTDAYLDVADLDTSYQKKVLRQCKGLPIWKIEKAYRARRLAHN
jgi:hypothetical protein